METQKDFNIPQQVLSVASLDDLKFIFSEAKDKLEETIVTGYQLYQRSILLLSSSIVILTTIIGYVSTNWSFTPKIISLVSIGIMLWFICSVLKDNVKTKAYRGNGTTPSFITVTGMFTDLDNQTPEWHLHVHLIEKYNSRIVLNGKLNTDRSDRIIEAINFLYFIPPIALLSFAITSFFF
jgi:hypothetical protein